MDQGLIVIANQTAYIFYKKGMTTQTYLSYKGQKAEKMKPVIYIVDDDESVRRAMKRLIRSAGMEAQTFASAHELLDFELRKHNACLVVDVKMRGMSGLELQDELRAKGSDLPVIFITGFDTPETRNQAKKAGAVGYFRKPIDDQALLDSIQWALTRQKPYQDPG